MTAWLNIIGVSEEGVEALSPNIQALIASAKTVLGPARLIESLTPLPTKGVVQSASTHQNHVVWTPPLSAMLEQITSCAGTPTIILATGDPNWFGIGATLSRHLPTGEFAIHPGQSSFQLAAARLHWPLQNVMTMSLHGRPATMLHPHVLPGHRILTLTSDRTTLTEVATILINRGYGESCMTVLEHLGSPDERLTSFPAGDATNQSVGDFYVLAIDCVSSPDAALLPPNPGLPDSAFVSDGQLTKRDVRAATLAKLAPTPGALLWDVGAGCGSVAIEWMRAARDAKAIAFEKNPARVALIKANSQALGTPTLKTLTGDALENCADIETPDAVFIGGDVSNEPLFMACWAALKPQGRLVANAVTLDGEKALFDRQALYGGNLIRLEIAVLDKIGDERIFRPRMAVTQWSVTKGTGSVIKGTGSTTKDAL